MLLEQPPDRTIDFGADVIDALLRIRNPEAQFQFDAVVAEMHEARDRWGIAQNALLAFAGLEQHDQGQFRIVRVTDAYRQLQAYARIRVTPIDDRVRNQLLIGHQGFDAVPVPQDDVAAAQFVDPAEILRTGAALSGETDDIARFDRPVHEQDEAETKTDGARQHRQGRQVDSGRIEAHQDAQADQERVGEFCDADARRRRNRREA